MAEWRPEPARPITPKDVFQRSNMPSRWERLTSVSPKTATDRKYLAFVAARYRGDELLPHPDELAVPAELRAVQIAKTCAVVAAAVVLTGVVTQQLATAAAAGGCLAAALVVLLIVSVSAGPKIRRYHDVRARAEAAQARLQADGMDTEDSGTLNEMIINDEGTLAYCAAKIASEIEQDPGWRSDAVGVVPIDLWDELTEIGASARQIAEDRRTTESLERGRLRDDPTFAPPSPRTGSSERTRSPSSLSESIPSPIIATTCTATECPHSANAIRSTAWCGWLRMSRPGNGRCEATTSSASVAQAHSWSHRSQCHSASFRQQPPMYFHGPHDPGSIGIP